MLIVLSKLHEAQSRLVTVLSASLGKMKLAQAKVERRNRLAESTC